MTCSRICRRFVKGARVRRCEGAKVRGCEGARVLLLVLAFGATRVRAVAGSVGAAQAGRRQLADVSRRLLGTAAQPADADHAGQRAPADAGVGVSDQSAAADQGHADPRQRRDLHHDARQPLGDRRAVGAADLALHVSGQRRLSHRPSRRGGLQGLRLPDDSRCASGRARRARRQGALECRDRRSRSGLLVDQRAARASAIICSSAWPATSTISPARSKSFDPETGKVQWTFYSTPPPERQARRAAAPPAVRCG